MMLRFFCVGVLATITLVLVYGNKPIAAWLLATQTLFLDGLTAKFPAMGSFHWTAAALSRSVLGTLLYIMAIACAVGAILIFQLPPPPIPH